MNIDSFVVKMDFINNTLFHFPGTQYSSPAKDGVCDFSIGAKPLSSEVIHEEMAALGYTAHDGSGKYGAG